MEATERFAGVVIVAAGKGERFGDTGKVMAEAGGKPLLCWSLQAALGASTVCDIVIVAGSHTRAVIADLLRTRFAGYPIRVCVGGERRQDSVRAGVSTLDNRVEVAVIHDAARPLATAAMFDAGARAARANGAAITGVPVIDTIKEVEGSRIVRTVDRTSLRAAQTPQAFRRSVLHEAYARADSLSQDFTDEAGLLESLGYPVTMIDGDSTNLKVTVPDDLELVEFLLARRSTDGGPGVSS